MNKFHLSFALAIGLSACGGADSDKAVKNQTPPNSTVNNSAVEPQSTEKKPVTTQQVKAVSRGEKLYSRCKTCHTLKDGGKHRVGPNLWDIYGKKAGSRTDFAYSKAMLASDVIWTDETIDAYITKPAAFMKGNRMTFVGIRKAEDRAALLEYLRENTQPAPTE